MEKEKIAFVDFMEIEKKLEIKLGQIVAVERIPKKDKLLQMTVSFGPENSDKRTVVTNLGGEFEPEDLLNRIFPFITNLEPVKLGGVLSEAMIMVPKTTDEDGNERIHLHDMIVGGSLM